jgi:aminoglycoside phosphotransferase (APT) family kinase protein
MEQEGEKRLLPKRAGRVPCRGGACTTGLQELGKDSNVFGIIHRDLHLNNILFHDGEAYVIDFEVCGWGYYLFDVAVTLLSLEGFDETPLQVALLEGTSESVPSPKTWRYLETFHGHAIGAEGEHSPTLEGSYTETVGAQALIGSR